MIRLALKLLVIFGVSFYGGVTAGFAGIFYALMVFGLLCFAFQLTIGVVHSIASMFSRPRVRITNNTMNVRVEDGPAIKGTRINPDPTRPTTDDFMGIIESKTHRQT